VVASHQRSWLRRPPILALDSFDRAEPDPGLDPELMDLAHSIAKLERSYAEVISLRFINCLSLQETASVLGVSVDAVKARQARALVRLRSILKPHNQ
jgi:DNA-directed RNA polymerase specialized sigma24 family protein